jgi:hypothetical protein
MINHRGPCRERLEVRFGNGWRVLYAEVRGMSHSEHDRKIVDVLRSVGRGGNWLIALYLAGLGLASALLGLAADLGVEAAFFLALSVFFFLPLGLLLRGPKSEGERPRGTADISKDWRERVAMADDPATSIDLLNRLAGDPMTAVRAAVATNPSTPMPTIERLRKDPDRGVRHEAERRSLAM